MRVFGLLMLLLVTELDRFDAVVQASSSAGVKVIVVLKGDTEVIKHVTKWECTSDSIKFGVDLESNRIKKLILLDQHDYSIATIKTDKNTATLLRKDVKNVLPTKFYIEYCRHESACEESLHFSEVH